MHPLKSQYYQSRYLATVRFSDDDNFVIEGGKEEKKALLIAKQETTFCYVRDIVSKSEVRLELIDGHWVRTR
jgi:hypothetical protein